ncbi:MAG: ABC transporter substrate-binding protein [Spirochaetales bacterium]|nr:ABC transporter substrate-binding protein [Spirochaetales bacterium]
MSTCKRVRGTVVAVVVIAALMLASCGGEATEDAPVAGGGEAVSGGSIAIPIVADPIFNPWHPNAFAESNVINRVLFSGLTKPGLDLAPAPDLAARWEVSDDGLAWTFFLRDDVRWHDGEPFTAEDVAYTFNRIALVPELGANNASYFSNLDRVEIVDDHTVVFRLTGPVAALPAYLSFNTEILPQHIFDGQDPWELISFNKELPIGTGAFKLDEYISGQSVRLVANPDYYDGAPLLETVEYKVLSDVNTHVAQALSGELSIFVLDDQAALARLENADDVEIVPTYTPRFFWIALNQENELFTDVRVRQAMLHAIDRPYIIETVLSGYGTIADAGISPAMQYFYNPDVARYEYDRERALELFAEAGWTDSDGDGVLDRDGEPFSILFEVGIQGNLVRIGQIVQQQLQAVGLDVTFETLEWNTMIQKNIIRREYDMILNWWRYPADPDLLPYFHSSTAGTGYNIPGYQDARLDELLEAGSTIADPEQRRAVYFELQEYMAEMQPYLFLWYPLETEVRTTALQGVPDSLGFGDSLHYIDQWWIR